MSPISNYNHPMATYYNNQAHSIQYNNNNNSHYYRHQQNTATSPTLSSVSSVSSSSSTTNTTTSTTNQYSAARLGQMRAQIELARNFYDDFEFCPVQCSSEVLEHRDRVQQRLSPQSSPATSPHAKSTRRAIPIIDPSNMAPVSVSYQSTAKASSPQQHYYRTRQYSNVLIQ